MARKRDKTYRLIVGALLGSNLTNKELLQTSERLIFDSRWSEQLGLYLREIVDISEFSKLKFEEGFGLDQADSPEFFAYEIVELFSRKRLPKKEVLAILSEVSASNEWKPNPNLTVRENSMALLQILGSRTEALNLTKKIRYRLGYGGDSYLRELT